MTPDWYHEQVAMMIRKGRAPDRIARMLEKSVAWVEEAAAHPDVIEYMTDMREMDLAKADPEMWSKERTSLEMQAMGPQLIKEAYKMALDPKVNDATRSKLIEMCLKYNEQMPAPKEAVHEGGNTIVIDEAVGERLLNLARTREDRARLVSGDATNGQE